MRCFASTAPRGAEFGYVAKILVLLVKRLAALFHWPRSFSKGPTMRFPRLTSVGCVKSASAGPGRAKDPMRGVGVSVGLRRRPVDYAWAAENTTMTTPFLCVMIAYLVVYLPRLPVAVAQARQPEGYDNKHPRQQQSRLEGLGARAAAAHLNGFEAFPGFAAAVIINHLAGSPDHRTNILCVAFVVARTLYVAAYLANQDYLRSAIWGIGFLCTMALFCLPLLG